MASKSEADAIRQECIEFRKRPDASLNRYKDFLYEKYQIGEKQAERYYAQAGKIMKQEEEEERQAYLDSITAQLDKVYEEAVTGILQIKKDNQNTKKMTLSFIKQLQDELDRSPDQIQQIVPILNKLIDSINRTNFNESKVIEIMGKWKGLEQPQTQVNIQNNYELKWGNAEE